MKTIKVNVTSFDSDIPNHEIELMITNIQTTIIKMAANSAMIIEKQFKEMNIDKESLFPKVVIHLDIAKWKNIGYKMDLTMVGVNSSCFYVYGHTEELNILLESEEIGIEELG
ncbi:MAG: hypothetical protein R2825_10830 [Saprospiraceae bacterium]